MDDGGGVACGHRTSGDVTSDHRTGTNDCVIADGDALENDAMGTDEHPIADGDGCRAGWGR